MASFSSSPAQCVIPLHPLAIMIYNYNNNNIQHNNNNLFTVLEAKRCEKESCSTSWKKSLRSIVSQPIAGADLHSTAPPGYPPAAPKQTTTPISWLSKGDIALKQRHPSLHISNKLSSLSDTPAEKTTLVIGSPTLQNVKLKTPTTIVKCISGATAGDFKPYLKLLYKRKFDKIVIHVIFTSCSLKLVLSWCAHRQK